MAASETMPSSKTIAVDANPATREVATGTEVYTREICVRLQAAGPEFDWRFYSSRARSGLGFDLTVLPFRRLWTQARLPWALARRRPDLLFVPAHALPFAWPGKALTVVHDLAFERHPSAYAGAERAYLRASTRWAARKCPLLIAVSESTRADLVELYGVKPERVRVVPLGVNPPQDVKAPAGRLAELGVDGNFVLQVGRVEARKNQAGALAAVEKLDGVTLVVAGPERDAGLANRLRDSGRCRVLGKVDAPTLELLYKKAAAVVVPSLYEGFGLPVLEAMARGKVVVAAKASSLPEVGGEAALYFHEGAEPGEVANVIDAALHDQALRSRLVKAARARAARYTWDRAAEGVVGVVRELIG